MSRLCSHSAVSGSTTNFAGLTKFSSGIGVNGNNVAAQIAGWGSPTGAAVQSNFSGSSATLAQTSAAVAEIIVALKQIGFFAS